MYGANQIFGPASETYAGFAWEHLRRNLDYGRNFEKVSALPRSPRAEADKLFRFEYESDSKAYKWGLECFETPKATGLEALVFWRQDVFPGALSVQYHDDDVSIGGPDSFNLSHFDCLKQHYVKSDGTRISVIKSQDIWLQIAGKPKDCAVEDQSFSVLIHGGKGARRRIDALRQLTSLSRDGIKDFKLLGRQKAFSKIRNGLLAYDIHSSGGSYKDVAIALFGTENVQQNWDSAGCFLKARAVRAFKFGERMVAQDYQSLLPKKTL